MLSKEYEKKLDEEYELLNSNESQEYTKKVLLEMGKCIQKLFPGVEFELKARFKSPKSFKGKKERIRKSPEKEKPIYDNIGFCLIVKSVSDDFDFEHAYCSKLVKQRIENESKIDNEKSALKVLEMKYKNIISGLRDTTELAEKIEELKKSDNPDENVIRLLEESLKENEKLKKLAEILKQQIEEKVELIEKIGNEQYEFIDNQINEMIATHIMNKLMNNKAFMSPLKLEKIPGRTKNHDGGKSGYYIAFHDALKSKLLKYWMVDLHAMSDKNYKVSQLDHSKAEGKARKFPRIDSQDFQKIVLETVPRNLVYQNGIYEDGVEVEPGKVYECSEVENMAYYYAETLSNNKDTFEYVVSDTSLFSGKGKRIIENKEGSIIEKEISESEMEL